MPKLPNGDYDVIKALYTDTGISPNLDGTKDPYRIAKVNYPEGSSQIKNLTEEIKVILAEGLRDPLSLSTKKEARLCIGTENTCDSAYKVKVRAMITKFPGFQLFTGYQSAQFAS